MELSIRDWMIIIGVLLILAVLLDGFRRVRRERRNRIRVALNKHFLNSGEVGEEPVEPRNSELPNGGARVIHRVDRSADERIDLEQSVPMLMESVVANRPEEARKRKAAVSAKASKRSAEDEHSPEYYGQTQLNWDGDGSGVDSDPRDEALLDDVNHEQVREDTSEATVVASKTDESTAVNAESHRLDTNSDEGVEDSKDAFVAVSTDASADISNDGADEGINDRAVSVSDEIGVTPADPEVIIVNVMAGGAPFKGTELLHILLACDVRFGKMNIFHRYEKANGSGRVQFSVANLVEPGVFDLDRIDDFTTPGVCFFMGVSGPEDPLLAFDCLIETAQCVVKNLGGEMRDESHSVMTRQTEEHCRARIREAERRRLTRHA